MKKCKKCGKPIPDWAELCPGCTPIRVEEVVASVFYIKDEVQRIKHFTDSAEDGLADAVKFFERCPGKARLVVKDPLESWRRVREK